MDISSYYHAQSQLQMDRSQQPQINKDLEPKAQTSQKRHQTTKQTG